MLNTLTLHTIIKHQRQRRRPYHILVLDLAKAFDSLSHNSIRRALERFDVDKELIFFILEGYVNATTQVEVGNDTTPPINLNRGVKQGDPLSPILFNIVLDELIEDLQESGLGIKADPITNLTAMAYVDDLLLAHETYEGAQRLLRLAIEFCERRGLEINPDKSVAMAIRVVPGKKIPFTSQTNRFYKAGLPI